MLAMAQRELNRAPGASPTDKLSLAALMFTKAEQNPRIRTPNDHFLIIPPLL